MPAANSRLETFSFFIILGFFTLAFLGLMFTFFGAIFWATILSILFTPVQRFFEKSFKGKRNIAAILTLLCITLVVIMPVIFVANSLVQEGSALLGRLKSGNLDFGLYLKHMTDKLPDSMQNMLDKAGWRGDLEDVRSKLSSFAMLGSQFAANQAYSISQVTIQFVISLGIMLYLLFFFLRDGSWMSDKIKAAIPLSDTHKNNLIEKFTTVIRATVKGSIIVAIVQGTLGGIAFWFLGIQGAVLWGVIMVVLSLVPVVGSSIVWIPVAGYFLATGQTWQGVILILYGIFVISLVDTLLRPILVGKDTKLPDWLVMLSTLGGLSVLGPNGFVLGPLISAMFIAVWAVLTELRSHALTERQTIDVNEE